MQTALLESNVEQKTNNTIDYIYARKSKYSNLGIDFADSARHKRNAWTSLEEAEQSGNAEIYATREHLLKYNPLNFGEINSHSSLYILGAYFSLMTFPKAPIKKYSNTNIEILRRDYCETYIKLKGYIEETLTDNSFKDWQSFTLSIRDFVRKTVQPFYSSHRFDSYFQFKKMLNSFGSYSSHSPIFKINQLIKMVPSDSLSVSTRKIIEGKSLKSVMGKTESQKRSLGVSRANFYNSTLNLGEIKHSYLSRHCADYLMDVSKAKGIQWGNGVTDTERDVHLKFIYKSFKDLSTVLNLADEQITGKCKLGVAVGARGQGRALAHFEPSLSVINLTRKRGFGSLAHEWAHFIDAHISVKLLGTSGYLSETNLQKSEKFLSEYQKIAFSDMKKFIEKVSYRVSKTKEIKDCTTKKYEYWTSLREVFARSFEGYLSEKLKIMNIENTYLVDCPDHSFWPTKEEKEESIQIFDKFFSLFNDYV